MIYRILVDSCLYDEQLQTDPGPLRGAWNSCHLSYLMDELGLCVPDVRNKRARFYFTEKGWRQVGRLLASEARKRGHTIKVLRLKNPKRSQIVYADDLQIAILPETR